MKFFWKRLFSAISAPFAVWWQRDIDKKKMEAVAMESYLVRNRKKLTGALREAREWGDKDLEKEIRYALDKIEEELEKTREELKLYRKLTRDNDRYHDAGFETRMKWR